ncbi:MAG TPA: hypothetical protein VG778_08770, partial [Blastocatellia bacterium]|nr:hypothetical protein [Blastocatellia bacterium]
MKSNHKLTTLITCIVLLSLAVAQASSDRTKLGDTRSVALPPFAILDDDAQPAMTASGKVGFVSSITAGSLIAFSVSTGRVLSSIVVGENAGPVSLVEASGRRLAAVPAANNPSEGHPATITIVDVTSTQSLEIKSLLVLPVEAQITQTTRALLTEDGKFCLIATSIGEPALFVFDVESGELLSRMSLLERSGEVALHEDGDNRLIAVVSALANTLSVISLEGRGNLNLVSMFSPQDARFGEANNPAFNSDGRSIYIAASEGDRLYAIDSRSGAQFGSLAVSAPHRVNVSRTADGADLIGVTRIRRPANGRPGGATVVAYRGGRLTMKAEFTPPADIEFTKANNLVFDRTGDVAFIGSDSGTLFAFNTSTGEL